MEEIIAYAEKLGFAVTAFSADAYTNSVAINVRFAYVCSRGLKSGDVTVSDKSWSLVTKLVKQRFDEFAQFLPKQPYYQ